MYKLKKLPDQVLALMPTVAECLYLRPEILFAYLFGSLAGGVQKPFSDVDIAVYIAGNVNFGEIQLDILESLTDVLQTDEIDLVVLNTASLPLVINVLKAKRILVDRRPFERHLFESLMMRKYFDFSIKESAQLRRRYLDG